MFPLAPFSSFLLLLLPYSPSLSFRYWIPLLYISVWPTEPFGPRLPLGGIKIFQKEQPVMVIKPSLSIHIELYIINPFPNNKYWRTFFSFFYLRKDILPDFSLLGFKRKMIWIWKWKNFLGRRKKSLLIRPCCSIIPLKMYKFLFIQILFAL